MEQFQERLEGEPSEDPLWTSPNTEENISDSDVAEKHFGEEPPNLEEYMQTEDYIQEFFPSEQSENNSSDIESEEIYSSDIESEEIYISPVDLSTDTSDISDIDTSDTESSSSNSNGEDAEDAEERRQNERYRRRIINNITQWMAAVYQEKLEEELIYVQNNSDNIDWTDDRFIAFRLLCRTQIQETIQQLEEGSILCLLSLKKIQRNNKKPNSKLQQT